MNGFKRMLPGLLAFAGAIFLWQAVSWSGLVNNGLFPPPTQVFGALLEAAYSGELQADAVSSFSRVFWGFLAGGLVGVGLGLLTGSLEPVRLALAPLLHFLRNIPPIALVPLALVWFGIGEASKIFLIAWSVLFPVWINTHIGVTEVQKEFLWLARLFGADRLQTFVEVTLPASAVFIVAGLRIGVGMAFIALIAAELAGSSSGFGFLISNSHLLFRVDKMVAGILLLGFFGLLADWLFLFIADKLNFGVSHERQD